MPEKTGEKRANCPPVEHQFKPGNPGRPKGARNKLGEAFIQALHDSFEAHGPETIETVRTEKPDQYLKVIASLLPKEHTLNINDMDAMTDDELAERIRSLATAIAPFLDGGTGEVDEGNAGASVAQQPPRVH
ncbi:hypothetical protein [Novosphingobium mathurense]|uniref:DUF5681 domain-containing protein n=1 Tax=Novosphingobium mathurense TaxID=428990 RepID=A0A1U6I7A4_9SPHN|nr:hypothetical protein [Novosphingobium mathurense]SLK03883.1 hypothetical protein SAMN06295987_104297 [Novosphingobium mathurense]